MREEDRPKPHGRRTCRDRVRFRRMQRKRQGDPATSIFLQLLALVLALFGRAPLVPVIASSRVSFPRPTRDDTSPEQQERERGEGGRGFLPQRPGMRSRLHGRYRTRPTYRKLIANLRRPDPTVRDEAADVLRKRLPPEAHPWLDSVLERRDWSALAWSARPGATDEEVETAMLRAALDWAEARTPDGGGGSTPPPPGGDGPGP